MYQQKHRVIEKIRKEHKNGFTDIIVVTHGVTARVLTMLMSDLNAEVCIHVVNESH